MEMFAECLTGSFVRKWYGMACVLEIRPTESTEECKFYTAKLMEWKPARTRALYLTTSSDIVSVHELNQLNLPANTGIVPINFIWQRCPTVICPTLLGSLMSEGNHLPKQHL